MPGNFARREVVGALNHASTEQAGQQAGQQAVSTINPGCGGRVEPRWRESAGGEDVRVEQGLTALTTSCGLPFLIQQQTASESSPTLSQPLAMPWT